MLNAVLYVCVSCFVVRGCAVSRRYIDVCNCDMFSVIYFIYSIHIAIYGIHVTKQVKLKIQLEY